MINIALGDICQWLIKGGRERAWLSTKCCNKKEKSDSTLSLFLLPCLVTLAPYLCKRMPIA